MKTRTSSVSFLLLALALTSSVQASTITLGDPQAGGISYRWTATLGEADSGSAMRHVTAWSWEDEALFNPANGEPPVGWTHNSDWIALRLLSPAAFTFRLERQAGVPWFSPEDPARVASIASMFPSFTLWANWDNDDGDHHSYNNRGNVAWAEDLAYVDHLANTTLAAVESTWWLAAGDYTIALGSNAAATDTDRQGYRATFTTSPVPEPSVGLLLLATLLPCALRRQRAAE